MRTARCAERAGEVATLIQELSGRPARWWSTIGIIFVHANVGGYGKAQARSQVSCAGAEWDHGCEHSAVAGPRKEPARLQSRSLSDLIDRSEGET